MSENKYDYIKCRTLELYDSLPQEREARQACTHIRDEIIELNYAFFGYIATHTFINNSSISYEDKFQSALMHFCECWWWYRWKGDDNHKGYRQDISFTVFFKPRVGEMIERELNTVKYSIRRDLCMEAGKQLGKHWGKVTHEDLKHIEFESDKQGKTNKLASLKAIFGSMYVADLDTHAMFISTKPEYSSIIEQLTDNYDSIEEFLIHEMIDKESRLTDSDLETLSETYYVDLETLRKCLPKAERMLYAKLIENIDIQDTFRSDEDTFEQ